MEEIYAIVEAINSLYIADLCKAVDNWNFVKEFPCISYDDEHNCITLISEKWLPKWKSNYGFSAEIYCYKSQVLYKWLYLHSLWKTLAYVSINTYPIEVKYLYQPFITSEANKEKMILLYKNCYIKETDLYKIILINLPANINFCEALFNVGMPTISTFKNIIKIINSYTTSHFYNTGIIYRSITYRGVDYLSRPEYIAAMNFSDIIKSCNQNISGIKFSGSLRNIWITACLCSK